jgi:hypothetical protein
MGVKNIAPSSAGASSEASGADRRGVPRVQDAAGIVVTIVSAPDSADLTNRRFCCRTSDISATGLRLSVPLKVPTGTSLLLMIAVTNPLRSFKKNGHVVWSRSVQGEPHPFAIGVELDDLSPEALGEWRTMIGRKLAGQMAAP